MFVSRLAQNVYECLQNAYKKNFQNDKTYTTVTVCLS